MLTVSRRASSSRTLHVIRSVESRRRRRRRRRRARRAGRPDDARGGATQPSSSGRGGHARRGVCRPESASCGPDRGISSGGVGIEKGPFRARKRNARSRMFFSRAAGRPRGGARQAGQGRKDGLEAVPGTGKPQKLSVILRRARVLRSPLHLAGPAESVWRRGFCQVPRENFLAQVDPVPRGRECCRRIAAAWDGLEAAEKVVVSPYRARRSIVGVVWRGGGRRKRTASMTCQGITINHV